MKSEILQVLKKSRQSHLEWVVHAARLMVEIDESDAKKPQLCTRCDFGLWYYKEGCNISKLPGLKRIAGFHEEFHQSYSALYFTKFDRRGSLKQRKRFNKKNDKKLVDFESTLKDKFQIVKIRYDALEKEIQALEKIVSIMNEKLFEKDRLQASST